MEFFIETFCNIEENQLFAGMTENQKDIELLATNPDEIIVKYAGTINAIVQKRLINTGFYMPREKEDLFQEISLRLLEEKYKIREQYDKEKAQFVTFISLKIVNHCYQVLRKDKRSRKESIRYEEKANLLATGHHETDASTFLIDEFKKFEAILTMYYRKRAKIELVFQILFRISAPILYFINYCKKYGRSFFKAIKERLPREKEFTDKQIFAVINKFLNKCEIKNNTEGAAQRWLNKIKDEFIDLMNKGLNESIYDKETFQVLVEKYYERKNE
jgi:hypothetical protein